MNIFITLDYEIFFGNNPGTVKNCILQPSEKLHQVVKKYGYKLCNFVDVGFLLALKKFYSHKKDDYEAIVAQLRKFSEYGHDSQLHIHPHWEDAILDGDEWGINDTRYRLHDFREEEINDIVYRYKNELDNITENTVNTYRAGGWSIQPFGKLKSALKKNDIYIDSTVFPGGYYSSEFQYFDFREVPSQTSWNFEGDPCSEDNSGGFLEIPISSHKVSPTFFWKLAFTKLFGDQSHKPYGDGFAIKNTKKQLFRLLTRPSYSVVSIDGFKANFLEKAYKKYAEKWPSGNFVIIGHPKSVTDFSISKLESFLEKYSARNKSMVFSDLKCNHDQHQ